MSQYNEYIEFAKEAVKTAGEATWELFNQEVDIQSKGHEQDLVTTADLNSNEIILNAIAERFPEHGIASEEVPEDEWDTDKEFVWIIDPLDGTRLFAAHWPVYGVMMTLAHNGEFVGAAIYYPAADELLWAEKGQGAYVNGKRVHCSDRPELKKSMGSFSTQFGKTVDSFEAVVKRSSHFHQEMLTRPFHGFYVWCVAIGFLSVATGRFDWMAIASGKVWDFAPGSVILKEAGCMVTDEKGDPISWDTVGIVAANPALHAELMEIISWQPVLDG